MLDFLYPPWWKRWFGTRSEREAARFLRRQHYRILARNYSCSAGELDIVALDGETIVFVEVRSTSHEDVQRATLSVGMDKQRRVARAAMFYLQRHSLLGRTCRFDVISISWPPDRKQPWIEHHVNAFEPGDRFQMYS